MVEHQLPKLNTRVRFPSSAQQRKAQVRASIRSTWAFIVRRSSGTFNNVLCSVSAFAAPSSSSCTRIRSAPRRTVASADEPADTSSRPRRNSSTDRGTSQERGERRRAGILPSRTVVTLFLDQPHLPIEDAAERRQVSPVPQDLCIGEFPLADRPAREILPCGEVIHDRKTLDQPLDCCKACPDRPRVEQNPILQIMAIKTGRHDVSATRNPGHRKVVVFMAALDLYITVEAHRTRTLARPGQLTCLFRIHSPLDAAKTGDQLSGPPPLVSCCEHGRCQRIGSEVARVATPSMSADDGEPFHGSTSAMSTVVRLCRES